MNKSINQKKCYVIFSAFKMTHFWALLAMLICFAPLTLFSQLKLNSKAPKIDISNWINVDNIPKIENKFIILDFWATWCAPCLGALPHMNQLQLKFKNHKDLLFLSLTDEKPTKINEILSRFHFESSIISDTTGNTHKAYKIESLPAVFLIDNKGYIKWSGDPKELTGDILNGFLKGESFIRLQHDKDVTQSSTDNHFDSLFKTYRSVFDDPKISNYVNISKPDTRYSGKFTSKVNSKVYNVCQVGIKISSLFSNLLHCNENQLILPIGLRDKTISYCFKTDSTSSKEEGERLLLTEIAQHLGISLVVSEVLADVIVLKVADIVKLNRVKAINNNAYIKGTSSLSNDLKVVSVYNSTLQVLENQLNKVLDKKIEIINLKDFSGNYSLTINNSSFDDLRKSFLAYGFKMKIKKQKIPIFQFSNN